ncbi:MAG: hypothetical protein ABI539_01480 [Acidobacteriota bacterium]
MLKNPRLGDANNSSNSNKTLTDRAVDAAVGEEKIGVKECDEVVDFFNSQASDPDDDLVTKAAEATILKKLKENFRKAVEENKSDKAQLAKTCREFKVNLDKFKAEQDSSNKE